MPSLRLRGAARSFDTTAVLARADLTIGRGEFVAIEGPSGSGKSTLLNILGLLDRPTAGSYRIGPADPDALSEAERTRLRAETFGFIFQSFHLLDRRPVVDSVELGLLYRGFSADERRERALAALHSVGLARLAHRRANALSGGERQRVAIARALAADVPVIVADEPTGNLDSVNSDIVVDLLRDLHRGGATVVIVTHDPAVARQAERRLRVIDGVVTERHGDKDRRDERSEEDAPPRRVPTRRSRLRDLLQDAISGVGSRAGRAAGVVAAVGVAIGLTLATVGLAETASQQVKQTFDSHSNRDVAVSWGPAALAALDDAERGSLLGRLAETRGVSAVAVVATHGETEISVGSRAPRSVAVYSASDDLERAGRLDVDWGRAEHKLAAGEALIGETLASRLELAPLRTRPVVRIGGTEFEIVGTVASSPRIERLPSSVVVSTADAARFAAPQKTTAVILTMTGAARQVAGQAPLVINPYQPGELRTHAPPDPRTLRDSIQRDVQAGTLALSAVALAAAIIGLGNAMTSAVLERRQEFGLRRALGARPRQLFLLVVAESAIVGAAGGAVGLVGGVVVVLCVTIARRWSPVIDPTIVPLALIGGVIVGALAGVVAAAHASRVSPSEALRH